MFIVIVLFGKHDSNLSILFFIVIFSVVYHSTTSAASLWFVVDLARFVFGCFVMAGGFRLKPFKGNESHAVCF